MTESFAVPHQETEEEVSMDMEYAMRIGELQKKVCVESQSQILSLIHI